MTLPERTSTSVEEFDAFIQTADRKYEYIAGEIVEVPSNAYVSEIAGMFLFFLRLFLRENNLKGHITGEAGGYQVAGERYAPDVAYIAYEKQPTLSKEGYNPIPPDLAVEVVSSDRAEEAHQLRIKVSNYLLEGVVVWVVRPEDKLVEVHAPGQPVKLYREADTLDGGDVLPGFAVTVKAFFDV